MEEQKYAPIVIFVYNRADRVQKLIQSLAKNPEAKHSSVYIYSDGAKDELGEVKVQNVRSYIDTIAEKGYFRAVHIQKAKKNKGLAKSIIEGVSEIMEKHGRAIVVEDDNIVSPDFLDYMNRGLEYYKDDSEVWAVGGFSRKMSFPQTYGHDVYAMQRISSYTWASWKDRWEMTDWEVSDYPRFLFDRRARKKFDYCGKDRSLMLDAQMCGKISSWAIRFEYSMVKNNMYCVLPCLSRAICSGNDGSGTHGTKAIHTFDTEMSDGTKKITFERVKQNDTIRKEYVKAYKRGWKRLFLGNLDYIFVYYRKRKR